MASKVLQQTKKNDDTTMYIGSYSSLVHLKTQLMHFRKATDKKYNKIKCMGIWLGSNRGNLRKPLGYKWNSDTLKILG